MRIEQQQTETIWNIQADDAASQIVNNVLLNGVNSDILLAIWIAVKSVYIYMHLHPSRSSQQDKGMRFEPNSIYYTHEQCEFQSFN